MQVVVDNLLTNYELHGKGRLVLFLHGWGDNSQGSLALQKELAKNFTVLAPDLPGFGKTQVPPTAWGLNDYAAFTEALLKKLNLSNLYAVIGHSNGGAIAVRAIAKSNLKPEKVVLLAAAGIRSNGSARKGLFKLVAKTGDIATIGLPERYRQNLRNSLYKSAGSDMLVVEGMEETFKKVVSDDVQEDAENVTQPTLLIFGSQDKSVTPFMANRYVQALPNASLNMFDAGHFVHLEKPQETTGLIEGFLS